MFKTNYVNSITTLLEYSNIGNAMYVCKYFYAGPTLRCVLHRVPPRKWDKYTMEDIENVYTYIKENIEKICEEIDACYANLHALNIVHNDVKLDNICIHPPTRIISIIDFDVSSVNLPKDVTSSKLKFESSEIRELKYEIRNATYV